MGRKWVAYLTMEALIEKLPTYAGGLGILAGGMFDAAADLNYPFVLITLVNRKGYCYHKIENGEIKDYPEEYDPLEYFEPIDKKFKIELKDFPIYFTAWIYKRNSAIMYLLDTHVPENPPWLRSLTDKLYIEESVDERILKEILLGIGSVEILKELGYDVKKYHINETHGGFALIELYKQYEDFKKVREKIVFTTHTPLPCGHEKFDYSIVEKYYEIPYEIKKLSPDALNLSRLLFQLSSYSNAVSWKHSIVTKKFIPDAKNVDYITNGIYHKRWVFSKLAELYDNYIPGWRENPTLLAYSGKIPVEKLIEVKRDAKEELIDFINTEAYINKEFKEDYVLISIKRRFAGYKRIDMLFWDIERLENIGKKYNIQIFIGGVTHPKDIECKNMIKRIYDSFSVLSNVKVGLLLKKGINIERYVLTGSELFLHIPKPPFEASGTSWIRSCFNGTPVYASQDGSVIEIIKDNYNGWLFGKNVIDPNEKDCTLEEFYNKFESILELYNKNQLEYWQIAINAIRTVGPIFNVYRTFYEYVVKAYEK